MSKHAEPHWEKLDADPCTIASEIDQLIEQFAMRKGFEVEMVRLQRAKELAERGARMARSKTNKRIRG